MSTGETAPARRAPLVEALVGEIDAALRLPFAWIAVASIALVALYLIELGLCAIERDTLIRQHLFAPWVAHGPIFVLLGGRQGTTLRYAPLLVHGEQAVRIVESIALFVLYLAAKECRDARVLWMWISSAAVVMALASLVFPIALSPDLYSYAGYAHLGLAHAYDPPKGAFTGEFAIISRWWLDPIVPCPYGPFWVLFAKLATVASPTLAGEIAFFRVTNVIGLAVLFVALARAGVTREALALLVVSPPLYGYYVRDGHNDVWPVALLVLAMAWFHRSLALSLLCACAAALWKIPFLLLAPLACVDRSLPRRVAAYVAAAATITLALSWLLGGAPYLDALRATQEAYPLSLPGPLFALVLAAAVVAVGAAVLLGRRAFWCAYLFLYLRNIPYPWYMLWGLPYVVPSRAYFIAFGVLLPLLTYVVGGDFQVQ